MNVCMHVCRYEYNVTIIDAQDTNRSKTTYRAENVGSTAAPPTPADDDDGEISANMSTGATEVASTGSSW